MGQVDGRRKWKFDSKTQLIIWRLVSHRSLSALRYLMRAYISSPLTPVTNASAQELSGA